MSPHRLFRSPTARTVPLRSSRPLLHHRRHRCGLGVARLEDRTLLSGPSGDVLAAVAPKIELGTPKTGTLAPGEVAFFQIDPTTDGRGGPPVHSPTCWRPPVLIDAGPLSRAMPASPQIDDRVPGDRQSRQPDKSRRGSRYPSLKTTGRPGPGPSVKHSGVQSGPLAARTGWRDRDHRIDTTVAGDVRRHSFTPRGSWLCWLCSTQRGRARPERWPFGR